MPRFCLGEASAKFGVSPRYVYTDPALNNGSQFVVRGTFDEGGNIASFTCYFTQSGDFVTVE